MPPVEKTKDFNGVFVCVFNLIFLFVVSLKTTNVLAVVATVFFLIETVFEIFV